MSWQWLENPAQPARWRVMFRVMLKALALFALVNVAFAALNPVDAIGRMSIYNVLVPGRERLPPIGQDVLNVAATIASHGVLAPAQSDEYRIVVIGDSGTRAGQLRHAETMTAHFNTANYALPDGRRLVMYNVAYPTTSLLKDFVLLEEILARAPDVDAVMWMATLISALPDHQLQTPLLGASAERVRRVVDTHGLDINIEPNYLAQPGFWNRTLINQRRTLADILRLQTHAFTWAASRDDGGGMPRYTIDPVDLALKNRWHITDRAAGQPVEFFTFDLFDVAHNLLGGRPLIIVNEPVHHADSPMYPDALNRDYKRSVYTHYRDTLSRYAVTQSWRYIDLWDAVPPQQFLDHPLHYDGEGARILANRLGEIIPQVIAEETP